jgi:hypothetical protein
MIIHLQQRSWSKGSAPFWIWASMVKYLCMGIVAWCRINYARTLFDQESERGVGAPRDYKIVGKALEPFSNVTNSRQSVNFIKN